MNIYEKKIMETNGTIINQASAYNESNDVLVFVTLPDTLFYGDKTVEQTRIFYSYDIKTDHVSDFAVPKGYTGNSLKCPVYTVSIDDTLFFLDQSNTRVSAMKLIGNRFETQYTIDMDSKTRSSVFSIIDSKMYTSKSTSGTSQRKSLSVYEINLDNQYSDSRILTDEKHFIEYTKYRDQLDSRINKLLKIGADEGNSEMILDFTEAMLSENTYFNVYAFKYNDKVLAMNGCGTDIYEIAGDSEKLYTTVDTMLSLREQEVTIMRENKLIPRHFDTYSQIQRVFCDESKSIIMIYLDRMKKVKEASGDMNDYLIIKFTGNNKADDEIVLPINFMPVYYNEETSTFYGLKKDAGVLKYVEYKLEV